MANCSAPCFLYRIQHTQGRSQDSKKEGGRGVVLDTGQGYQINNKCIMLKEGTKKNTQNAISPRSNLE